MRKLTETEVSKYIKDADPRTGVQAITIEMLSEIDVDSLPKLTRVDRGLLVDERGNRYSFDSFTPKAGSHYLKPSYAGRQVILGILNDEIIFSNGRWFSC